MPQPAVTHCPCDYLVLQTLPHLGRDTWCRRPGSKGFLRIKPSSSLAFMCSLNKFFCSSLCVLGRARGPAATLGIREEGAQDPGRQETSCRNLTRSDEGRLGEGPRGRAVLGKLIQVRLTMADFLGEGLTKLRQAS